MICECIFRTVKFIHNRNFYKTSEMFPDYVAMSSIDRHDHPEFKFNQQLEVVLDGLFSF